MNSDETKEQYSGAFGIDKENIYVLGLPRSDLYLDEKRMEEKAERFYQRFPELSGKRLILYAPTFRDEQVKNPELGMNLEVFLNGLHEDDVVMLRLHPYVAANFPEGSLKRYRGKIRNFSDYPEAAAVLAVSGLLITDYSSIIFEYCLLEKPIIFYAYDYEKFEKDGRSFYKDYTDYVPGEVVSTEKELLRAIGECETHSERVKDFKENSFRYLDGKSTKRLLHKILS